MQTDQTVLLSSHCLYGVIVRKWRGRWLHCLLNPSNDDSYSPISSIGISLYVAFIFLLNVLLPP